MNATEGACTHRIIWRCRDTDGPDPTKVGWYCQHCGVEFVPRALVDQYLDQARDLSRQISETVRSLGAR